MEIVSRLDLTTWIMIGTALVWLIYDIYAFLTKSIPTISDKITKWSYYSPVIPLVIGILLGHWLWTTNVCN